MSHSEQRVVGLHLGSAAWHAHINGIGSLHWWDRGADALKVSFSALCYPFDDLGPGYLYSAESHRKPFPLKAALDVLAGDSGVSVTKYLRIQKGLTSGDLHNPELRQQLHRCLLEWLRHFRTKVEEVCRRAYELQWGLDLFTLLKCEETDWVCGLGVTIPPHAGPAYRKLYLDLIGSAFNWSSQVVQGRVRFIIDSDSLAHTDALVPSFHAHISDKSLPQNLRLRPDCEWPIPVVCLLVNADDDYLVSSIRYPKEEVGIHERAPDG